MAKLTNAQRTMLEAVQSRLVALTTSPSPCAVAPEVKDAVRCYVESWILPNLREVLEAEAEGRPLDRELVRYAQLAVRPEQWAVAYPYLAADLVNA